MRRLIIAGTGLLFLTLTACSSSGPTGPTVDLNSRIIVAFGNSITKGVGDTSGQSGPKGYPLRLEQLLSSRFSGAIVLNRGVAGERTTQGLRRLNSVLRHDEPHYVLILEGVNDIVNSGTGSTETIIANLEKMVQAVKAADAIPLIASLLPTYGPREFKNSAIEAVNPLIRDLADRESIAFVDLHSVFTDHDEPASLIGDDGLHPTGAGYDLMAEAWHRGLLSSF